MSAPPKNDARRSSARGQKPRRGAPDKPTVRRLGQDRGFKVNASAARGIRYGHPWVFRDSVLRQLDGLEPGAAVRIHDEDGGFLAWGLFEPDGAIAVRVVGVREDLEWGPELIDQRIAAAIAWRTEGLQPPVGDAYRLVHAEGDGLPGLAVDRLGDYLLIYKYAQLVDGYLEHVVASLVRQLAPSAIYLQDRARPVFAEERRPGASLLHGTAAPTDTTVIEDGLSYLVDVTAPVSPGLFIDLREGRRWCEELAPGRRVLNLFSFTGSFGVRAVRAGAASVTNVDAAARSHTRCRQNLEASGLDPLGCKPLTGDVFKHLEKLRQRNERFDLVIVDPPPFSRVKGRVFSALRDWHSLMQAIAPIVEPGGDVLAVSNATKLGEDELMNGLGGGAASAGRTARLVGERGLPVDFPVPPAFSEGRYLKIRRVRLF